MRRFIILLVAALLAPVSAFANKATSYTYTVNAKGQEVRTQDAYLPDKTITTLGLSKPADLFIDGGGMLYIADAGNRRVLAYDPATGAVTRELKHKDFSSPSGLFINQKGELYVADPGARRVFLFAPDFTLLREYPRPDSPIFADVRYEPMKVAADAAGNLYVVSEGVYHGVIQLGPGGEFLGYFTVNRTRLNFAQALQKLLFTREQLENLVDMVPGTFSNVFVDPAGIVYTTTMATNFNALKKHRTDGGNMFVDAVFSSDALTDVWVDAQGILFATDARGYVIIYSPAGEAVFFFGSFVTNLDVAGLYASLPSIALDKNGHIWTLDGDKGYIQSFAPTDYALTVYGAMGLYEQGHYDESLNEWNRVLRLNQMSVMAHNGIAKAYFHAEDYEQAAHHFRVAGNRAFYSEAFWEVRNDFIQRWLPWAAGGILLLVILSVLARRRRRRTNTISVRARAWGWLRRVPVLRDVLFGLTAARHPVDAFYEVRKRREGSVAGATILYLLYFVVFMLYQTSKGFIYQFTMVEDMDTGALVAGYFLLIGLFVLCNWLVTSINDGDGNLAQCYMIPAYSMAPLMGALVTVLGLSYVLTYSESFILTVILLAGAVWTLVLLFLALMHVHDYTVKETVRTAVLTLVFMVIAVVIALVVLIMAERLFEFLKTVFEEVMRNIYE